MTEEGWPKEGKKGKNETDFSTPQRLERRRDFLEPELGGRKETQKRETKMGPESDGLVLSSLPLITRPVTMGLPRCMIRSFACDDTARLFRLEKVRAFPPDIQRTALRKLAQLHAVTELLQLRVPPGNRLEALKGDRKGIHSIRINDQWRICFRWESDGPHEVEIVDYH